MTAKNITIEQFDTICRICLSPSDDMKKYATREIYKMIQECTSVQEPVFPDLPKHICFMCYCRLSNAYNFKKQYFQSLQRLRDVLLQSKKYSGDDEMMNFDEIVLRLNNTEPVSVNFKTKKKKLEQDVEKIKKEPVDDTDQDIDQNSLSIDEPVAQSTHSLNSQAAEALNVEINPAMYPIKQESDDDSETEADREREATEFLKKELDIHDQTCNICHEHFEKSVVLLAHLNDHVIKDMERRKKETQKDQLRRHKAFDEKNFSCDICPKKFTTNTGLTLHKLRHKYKGCTYNCTQCDNTFKSQSGLDTHIRLKHPESAKDPYDMCYVCGKLFHPLSLPLHIIQIHSGQQDEEQVCNICGKMIKRKSYGAHVRTHRMAADGPQINCDMCDKRFRMQYQLKHHIKVVHQDLRPHKCMVCNKAFHTVKLLENHMFTHTREKRFTCDVCQKKFSFRSVLKTHMKVHKKKSKQKQKAS